jgi:hypothetical protein
MRDSNEQGLRVPSRKQFVPPPCSIAKHAVSYRSLPLRRQFDGFVNRRVWSCPEEEKLIQAKSQNLTKVNLYSGSAQAADPKIKQR